MSATIANVIAQSQLESVASRGKPTWVICYSCGCSFECHKPEEKISDTEVCGLEGCSGEPEDWVNNWDY